MDLQRLTHLLRKSWLVLVVFILAGVGLGVTQSQLTPPMYSSSTTLLFSLSSKGSLSVLADGSTYVQAMMPSYVKVMQTPLVLEPVIRQVGLQLTAKELSHKVTVDTQIDSVIADISVVDTDPEQAARIANSIANQVQAATDLLTPPSAQDLGQVSVTQISTATPANAPFSPRLLPHVIFGLLIGLVLGVAVVLLRDVLFSSAVNSREAVARATSAPLLGTFPIDPKARSRPLPADTQPMLPRSEGFRFMQSNLANIVRSPKLCLVVTSARADEGRTTTAANLAISIALANPARRVLLVDADLRNADIDDLLGVHSSLGLTSVVANRTPLEEAVVPWTLHRADDPQISFLAAGPPVPEPSDLLASESMSRLIGQARAMFDVVILDSAPLLDVTDGAILAVQADGAIIVVDAQKTRHRHVVESLARLRLAGAHVIGVVLNRMPETKEQNPRVKSAGHDINAKKAVPLYAPPTDTPSDAVIDPSVPADARTNTPSGPGDEAGTAADPVSEGSVAFTGEANGKGEANGNGDTKTGNGSDRTGSVKLYPSFPTMLPVSSRAKQPDENESPPTRPVDLSDLRTDSDG